MKKKHPIYYFHLTRPATLQGKRKPGQTVTWSKFSNIADAPGTELVIGVCEHGRWKML